MSKRHLVKVLLKYLSACSGSIGNNSPLEVPVFEGDTELEDLSSEMEDEEGSDAEDYDSGDSQYSGAFNILSPAESQANREEGSVSQQAQKRASSNMPD